MHIHGGDIYGKAVEMDFSANLNFLGMPDSVRQAAPIHTQAMTFHLHQRHHNTETS